jgi:hypothetical protein
MEEAISSLAALNTLTDREIDVLKQRFGVKTIDLDDVDVNIILPADCGGGGSAPPAQTSVRWVSESSGRGC